MKVFVIEDNPVYNDYVCNLLKKDSFDTMSAYNLATANIVKTARNRELAHSFSEAHPIWSKDNEG